ncbi:lysophospholipid acyltransferase family protein [Tsukamurella sp. 8F]|uniref:lysophospholipid acyltransferase family protein n=1 Tax=unclassified Tsukamurella TaxID=2633480 RepID=UPI0023B90540|nr:MULTISPECIES: lysophospholipid acyltransferase family protein [unclassified Tsukamurella]MDF0531713.1 lysophospholipid acyltransferase family protein [Tsukamurella sp. 8J]MDF0588959.1 lysophospholipid acyltransferase family protein [Tsukamurella sp. 8F]
MTKAQTGQHAKVLQLPVSIDTARRATGRERAQQRHPSALAGERTARRSATVHPLKPESDALAGAEAERAWRTRAADQVAEGAAFVRERLTGDYDIDQFGFDPHLTDAVFLPALRPVYDKWFRVDTAGIEHLPSEGGALLVANHSGVIPLDGLMSAVAVHDNHPQQRHLRLLAADLAFEYPVVGEVARKLGATVACNADAEALLSRGELVAVWPEGFKGIGKLYRDRYKLQRFGRGGFVTAAIRAQVPIIPVSIVGAEETYPMLYDVKPVARLLGLPYAPITPFFPWLGPLGMVPLPSKWHIEFGEPIPTDTYGAADADDPMVVFELTDNVRETIQQSLYRVLARRKNIFQDY